MAAEPLLKGHKTRSTDRRSRSTASSGCCGCCADAEDVDFEDVATAAQMVSVRDLRLELAVPFQTTSKDSGELLKVLYHTATGTSSPAATGDHWKAIGFQGKNPATDVRGAGMHGLRLLIRLLQDFPYFKTKLHASAEEYPFSACSLNVTRMLVCHLKLYMSQPHFCPCCGAAIRESVGERPVMTGFLDLLDADEDATFGVYAATMLLLDAEWARRRRTDRGFDLLKFNEVLLTARKQILKLLSSYPPSVDDLLTQATRVAGVPLSEFVADRRLRGGSRRARSRSLIPDDFDDHK